MSDVEPARYADFRPLLVAGVSDRSAFAAQGLRRGLPLGPANGR